MVVDGAYAKKDLLKPAKALGMTVVSRLGKDAALRTVPGPRPGGKRGRPRIYGDGVVDLAKRAGQKRGGLAAPSICTTEPSPSATRRSWRRGGRPAA